MEDLPPGKKAIGSKWVYKIKYNSDDTIDRYKAQVVVRGDDQVEGLDYTETFALVAKMASVRLFLALVVIKNWELYQMDINNVFLHGDLHEEVYMRPPLRFSHSMPSAKIFIWSAATNSSKLVRQTSRCPPVLWLSSIVCRSHTLHLPQGRCFLIRARLC